jgi:uncharacterized protein (TIRG00374 family)
VQTWRGLVWALGTVALEKMWDIWTLLTLVGMLALVTVLPDWCVAPTQGLALVAILVLVGMLLALRFRSTAITVLIKFGSLLPSRLSNGLHHTAERLLDGFEGLRSPQVWFWAVIWSVVIWGMGAVTNHTILLAFGLTLPFTASLMLLAALQMGVAVPSLPGRVGVFEGLCIVTPAFFGVEREASFAAGLVLHVVVFVPPIILGLYYAWRIKGIRP